LLSKKPSAEALYPYLLGAAAGASFAWKFALRDKWTVQALDQLFATILNVSAIGTGFLGTALSVLYSIEAKPVVRDLTQAGVWTAMLRYTMAAIRWSFAVAVLSAVGLFALSRINPNHYGAALTIWSFAVFTATFLCVRVIHLFSRILSAR
jgi:hypothetical protein